MAQAFRPSPPTTGAAFRVLASVTQCGFRDGWNSVWLGFLRDFSRFPLTQISFHYFSILVSFISFHFIRPCDVWGVVCRHPCNSLTMNKGASSHHIPRPGPVVDMNSGYKKDSQNNVFILKTILKITTHVLKLLQNKFELWNLWAWNILKFTY